MCNRVMEKSENYLIPLNSYARGNDRSGILFVGKIR